MPVARWAVETVRSACPLRAVEFGVGLVGFECRVGFDVGYDCCVGESLADGGFDSLGQRVGLRDWHFAGHDEVVVYLPVRA